MPDRQSSATVPLTLAINTGRFQREEELEFVMDFIEKSDAKRQRYMPIWDEVFDNYLVSPTGGTDARVSEWLNDSRGIRRRQSRLKDPETHQIIEDLSTQSMFLLMPNDEYVTASGAGAGDYEKGILLARLIMATLAQSGWFRTEYQSFKNSYIFGTSILQLGWEYATRAQMVKIDYRHPLTGEVVGTDMVPQEVVYRDNPLYDEIPIWDFYPDPSGTRIQHDMVGVAKRFETTKMAMERLASATTYEKAAVRRALDKGQTPIRERDRHPGYVNRNSPRDLPDAFQVMGGFEYWGEVPFKRKDGQNRVMTIVNGEVVRSHINPFIDGNIPFKEKIVNPLAGRFYGLAPGEVIRFLQDSADNMLMVFNDAANLTARNVLLVGQNFGGDELQLEMRQPNDVITVRDVNQVKPLPQDINSLQFAAQDYARRKFEMKEASGTTNPLQVPGDRRSATEASEISRLASQRVELMVEINERDFYPWVGKTLHSRYRQFLPPGGAVASLNGEPLRVSLDDIDFESDVRFQGSRQATSLFQQASQYREFFNTIGQNPAIPLLLPEPVVRYVRDILKIPDAERIIQQYVQTFLQNAQAIGQAGGGQQGPAALGATAGEVQREGIRLA